VGPLGKVREVSTHEKQILCVLRVLRGKSAENQITDPQPAQRTPYFEAHPVRSAWLSALIRG